MLLRLRGCLLAQGRGLPTPRPLAVQWRMKTLLVDRHSTRKKVDEKNVHKNAWQKKQQAKDDFSDEMPDWKRKQGRLPNEFGIILFRAAPRCAAPHGCVTALARCGTMWRRGHWRPGGVRAGWRQVARTLFRPVAGPRLLQNPFVLYGLRASGTSPGCSVSQNPLGFKGLRVSETCPECSIIRNQLLFKGLQASVPIPEGCFCQNPLLFKGFLARRSLWN